MKKKNTEKFSDPVAFRPALCYTVSVPPAEKGERERTKTTDMREAWESERTRAVRGRAPWTHRGFMEGLARVFAHSPSRKVADVARAFLSAKGRICRVTMLPQPSDAKRGGKVRVFSVNLLATWKLYEMRHLGGDGMLTPLGRQILRTKFSLGMMPVVESVRDPKGRFRVQPRTIDFNLVDTVRYGGKVRYSSANS